MQNQTNLIEGTQVPKNFDQSILQVYPPEIIQKKIIPMLVNKLNKLSENPILLPDGSIDNEFTSYISDGVLIKTKIDSEGQKVLHIEYGSQLKFDYYPGYETIQTQTPKINPFQRVLNELRGIEQVSYQVPVEVSPFIKNFEFDECFGSSLSAMSSSTTNEPLEAFITKMV
jgi:hypothetical protein